MTESLRPMSAGGLLDGVFSLYRRNFRLLVGVTMPGAVLVLLGMVLMRLSGYIFTGNQSTASVVLEVISFIAGIIIITGIYCLVRAAMVQTALSLYLGEPTSFRQAYASLRGRCFRVIWIQMLVALLLMLGTIGAFVISEILTVALVYAVRDLHIENNDFVVIVMFILILIFLLLPPTYIVGTLFARYSLTLPACLKENLKVRASLRRSKVLAKKSRVRINTVYGVCWLLGFTANMGVTVFSIALLSTKHEFLVIFVISAVNFVSIALIAPITAAALVILYYDERVRKEGYDLELLIAALPPFEPRQPVAPPPVEPLPVAPPIAETASEAQPAEAVSPSNHREIESPTE